MEQCVCSHKNQELTLTAINNLLLILVSNYLVLIISLTV